MRNKCRVTSMLLVIVCVLCLSRSTQAASVRVHVDSVSGVNGCYFQVFIDLQDNTAFVTVKANKGYEDGTIYYTGYLDKYNPRRNGYESYITLGSGELDRYQYENYYATLTNLTGEYRIKFSYRDSTYDSNYRDAVMFFNLEDITKGPDVTISQGLGWSTAKTLTIAVTSYRGALSELTMNNTAIAIESTQYTCMTPGWYTLKATDNIGLITSKSVEVNQIDNREPSVDITIT